MTSSAQAQIIRFQRDLIEILNDQLLNEIKISSTNNSNEKRMENLQLKEKIWTLSCQMGNVREGSK